MIAWRLHFTASKLRDPFREIASLSGVGRFTHVVGYQSYDLVAGYNLYAPTFEGVSKALNIQDLKLSGVAGEGEEVIWMLGTDGNVTGETYVWYSAENLGTEEPMWFGEDIADVTLTEGQGFYLSCGSEGAKITVAGAVKLGGYTRKLDPGYNITGNFSPVDINIQDIKLNGVDGEGEEVIWILGADGNVTGETYVWYSAENLGTEEPMWFGEDIADISIPAGQGIYMSCGSENATLTLPAVIPAK